MSLTRAVACATAVAACLAFAGHSRPAEAQAAGTSPSIGSWRFCTNCVDRGGDLSRYRYVGMNAWHQGRIGPLKSENPAVKALVYKDMASTRSDSCGGLIAAGVDYCWANGNRPDWFTLDGAGNRIEWAGYPGVWQMDVGNEAYQDAWSENVIAELRSNGWAGVVIDNANVDESGYMGGKTMREYPTQPAYQAATRSFLARVCPRVIAAGFLCLPNIQAHPVLANARLWADWIQFTSGGTREYWTKWGSGSDGRFGDGGWSDLQAVFSTVQEEGKIFLPVTYAPLDDAQSIRYARASFLLRWDGGQSAFVFAPSVEAQDPWSPEWTTDVGTPLRPPTQVGSAWLRSFSGGVVVVNPSQSTGATVDLGGSHVLPDGAVVTSVALAPMSGLVLRAAPSVAPPQPPVAQPPVAQPPVAQPPVAQPPVAQPPVAQPPVAQPPVAQPPVAQPPVAQPPVAQSPPATPAVVPAIALEVQRASQRLIKLKWRGATTSRVVVYRNGRRLASAKNSGSYHDRPTRGMQSLRYRVCNAGTSRCSMLVSANSLARSSRAVGPPTTPE